MKDMCQKLPQKKDFTLSWRPKENTCTHFDGFIDTRMAINVNLNVNLVPIMNTETFCKSSVCTMMKESTLCICLTQFNHMKYSLQ